MKDVVRSLAYIGLGYMMADIVLKISTTIMGAIK